MDVERRRRDPEREMGRVTPLGLLVLAAAYFGMSMGIWQLNSPDVSGAPWWPAAGLTLGVMCRVRISNWPAIAATVFAADFTADLTQGTPVATSLAWATANTIEPLMGAYALRRLFAGRLPNFASPGNVMRFFAAAALAGPPLASLIGATASSLTYDQDFLETWYTWYLGDVLGILVVAPVVLYSHQLKTAFDLRLASLLALTAAITLVVFTSHEGAILSRPYLVTPVLVAAAFFYGAPGAAAAGVIAAAIAHVASALGNGPYAFVAGNESSLVELQIFVAVQLLTIYLIVGVRTQMLQARAIAARLSEEQLIDPLTGVGNRLKLDGALMQVTDEPDVGAVAGSAATLFLDLDEFKPINDKFGHAAGDQVLITIAERIEHLVRDTDTVARVGGDEFAVVCPEITEEDTKALIKRLTDRLADPIEAEGHLLNVGVSIGYCWIPKPTGRPADLLRSADTAMYREKTQREGRGERRADVAGSL